MPKLVQVPEKLQNITICQKNHEKSLQNIIYRYLKSLSPIHFVKIRLSNFSGNEFLVKMFKL